jgi:hypothetical protein
MPEVLDVCAGWRHPGAPSEGMMETAQPTTLHLPAFLHGTYRAIKAQTKAEGHRCARHHRLTGHLPPPRQMLPVAPGDVVFTHDSIAFQDAQPAWRLFMISEVAMSLCEADEKNHRLLDSLYEASLRETPWGALYFALSGKAPESAERTALRLEAVLRFWDSLQHGCYLHKQPGALMTLDQLMTTACGWVVDAWCPEGGEIIRSRLEVASKRMARATREDCIEAILRQLPQLGPWRKLYCQLVGIVFYAYHEEKWSVGSHYPNEVRSHLSSA